MANPNAATALLRERVALTCALALTALSLRDVPPWHDAATDVCHQAAVAGVLTMIALTATRFFGDRGVAVERAWTAIFLGGMPLVYIASYAFAGAPSTAWLVIEILGLPVYAGLAVLGLKRSPWYLVAGMAAHGLAWDAWHFVLGSAVVPRWYASGCLLMDVGLAAYLASRVPAWRAAAGHARRSSTAAGTKSPLPA